QGLEAERLEEHLEDGGDRAHQHAVESPFDEIAIREQVKVPGEDVEKAQGHERETVEKDQLFEAPARNDRPAGKHDQEKTEGRGRAQERRENRREEVGAILQARLRVLGEVQPEEASVPGELIRHAPFTLNSQLPLILPES